MFSANGKSILERVFDTLPRMEGLPSSSPKGPETSVSGINHPLFRKLKAQRLRWTTAWRRLHKKIKQSDQGKQKKKKAFKKERAIEGVTIDAIKKMKTAKPEDRKALAEEAIREIKERKKAIIAKKAAEKKVVNKDKQAQQKAQDKAAQKAQKKNKKR